LDIEIKQKIEKPEESSEGNSNSGYGETSTKKLDLDVVHGIIEKCGGFIFYNAKENRNELTYELFSDEDDADCSGKIGFISLNMSDNRTFCCRVKFKAVIYGIIKERPSPCPSFGIVNKEDITYNAICTMNAIIPGIHNFYGSIPEDMLLTYRFELLNEGCPKDSELVMPYGASYNFFCSLNYKSYIITNDVNDKMKSFINLGSGVLEKVVEDWIALHCEQNIGVYKRISKGIFKNKHKCGENQQKLEIDEKQKKICCESKAVIRLF
jgi:hypothetical protein